MQEIARAAGRIQIEGYNRDKSFRSKDGGGDIVTEIDLACEKLIISRIKEEYPDDDILSEEAGSIALGGDRRMWIIDPLDGTRNYMQHIPFFCVSIAVTRGGVPEAGVVYDAIHDEIFAAERGKGATLNGQPISVADVDRIEDALVSVSWVRRKCDGKRFVSYIDMLSNETSYFRRFGAAALVMCYIACGRVHTYLQGGLCPWDVAAASLIIEEAGGIVTDFDGKPLDLRKPKIEVLTGNKILHGVMMQRVNS